MRWLFYQGWYIQRSLAEVTAIDAVFMTTTSGSTHCEASQGQDISIRDDVKNEYRQCLSAS